MRMQNSNLTGRIERLAAQLRPPERPSWQAAQAEHERVLAEVNAKFQAIIAEHYPNGVPVVVLSPEELAERGAIIRQMYDECRQLAADMDVSWMSLMSGGERK